MEKEDCIGHIQKRMGSALCRLVVEYKGKFLSESKKISGTGRLTKKVIGSYKIIMGWLSVQMLVICVE